VTLPYQLTISANSRIVSDLMTGWPYRCVWRAAPAPRAPFMTHLSLNKDSPVPRTSAISWCSIVPGCQPVAPSRAAENWTICRAAAFKWRSSHS